MALALRHIAPLGTEAYRAVGTEAYRGVGRESGRRFATGVGPVHAADCNRRCAGADRRVRVNAIEDEPVVWGYSDGRHDFCVSLDRLVAGCAGRMSLSGETGNES